MAEPYDKSDVNNGGTQSQDQNQSNGVNETDTGKRRSNPAPLYRRHPPPAQQNSPPSRRHI